MHGCCLRAVGYFPSARVAPSIHAWISNQGSSCVACCVMQGGFLETWNVASSRTHNLVEGSVRHLQHIKLEGDTVGACRPASPVYPYPSYKRSSTKLTAVRGSALGNQTLAEGSSFKHAAHSAWANSGPQHTAHHAHLCFHYQLPCRSVVLQSCPLATPSYCWAVGQGRCALQPSCQMEGTLRRS